MHTRIKYLRNTLEHKVQRIVRGMAIDAHHMQDKMLVSRLAYLLLTLQDVVDMIDQIEKHNQSKE